MNRAIPVSSLPRPWYKEPWPWLLMSLPVTAVVAGLSTWVIAYRSNDGLVAQDYYKQGLSINRVLARRERASQLGLSALLKLDGNKVLLELGSIREIAPAEKIRLSLINPVRAGLDQLVTLRREGETYSGEIVAVREGRWYFSLEDEGGVWQLSAETEMPLKAPVSLKP